MLKLLVHTNASMANGELVKLSSEESGMSIGAVFVINRTQAVRLPLDVRLPDGVHGVEIHGRGNERVITPLGQTWDSFFQCGPAVSDDFLTERAKRQQSERGVP